MSPAIQRVIVGLAVLISAGAFGYVVYRVTCSDCGKKDPPVVEPMAHLSAEGNSRLDRIANTISHLDTLTIEDALYLEESVTKSDEVFVQRWALVVMAEHLNKNSKMTDETRKLLEDSIFRELSSTNHRMAICAIASSEQAGLTERPEFRDMIISLRDGADPRVAARAARSPLPGESKPEAGSQTEGG